MDLSIDELQMAFHCSGLSHKGAEENSRPVLQEQNSLKTETFLIIPPPVAAAYLLSITVNITEHEVEGWEEAKHKPAAQCTCLAAAWSDI